MKINKLFGCIYQEKCLQYELSCNLNYQWIEEIENPLDWHSVTKTTKIENFLHSSSATVTFFDNGKNQEENERALSSADIKWCDLSGNVICIEKISQSYLLSFSKSNISLFSKKETLNPIIIFHCTGLEELWLWRVCFLYYDSEIVLSCFPCKNWCQYWAECKILTWIYACHHRRIFKFFDLTMTSVWRSCSLAYQLSHQLMILLATSLIW